MLFTAAIFVCSEAPNRSAVKGLAAAARKRKAAGEKHGQYKKAA